MADSTSIRIESPSYQAYQILHIAYVVAPVAAGIDKFFHFLVNWDIYLAPIVPDTLGVSAAALMKGVGIIEVVAGLLVAVSPRIGGWVVAAWLLGIIANLLLLGSHFDVALRDFGLALGACALARLSVDYTEI